jgi:nicotinamidase-related amidase
MASEFSFIPTGTVAVPEIPFKNTVQLPADKSVVIVVDMQNDFVKPGGSLVVPAAAETVPYIQQLVRSAREQGARVVYTQDTGFEGDPEFEIWPEHCRMGSWGWQIVDELEPKPDDLICQKNRYDGFYGTWLEHFLGRVWHVEHVVVVGTVSNICVLHTAASAGLRWYRIVLPADGISALTEFDQALTLHQVSWLYGGSVVRSTADIQFTATEHTAVGGHPT